MTKQYCVGCKAVQLMASEKRVKLRSGRWIRQGQCSVCHITMFKLGPTPKGAKS